MGIAPEAVAAAMELGESVKPFIKTTKNPRITVNAFNAFTS